MRRSDGGVLRKVQDEERDEGRQAGQDEERAIGDEGEVPDVRDRALPHSRFVRRLDTIALDSQAKALVVARAALDKQAEGVLVMDLRPISSITDFFVLFTADNTRHLGALKDHIETVLHQRNCSVWHTEGAASAGRSATAQSDSQWILMDCGDVVIHLFDRPARAFYRLEDLWADAPTLPLENLPDASVNPEAATETPRFPLSSPPR